MTFYEIVTLTASILIIILFVGTLAMTIKDAIQYHKEQQEQDEQEFCDYMIIQQAKASRDQALASLEKIKHNHGYDDVCYNQEIADAYQIVENYLKK